MGALPGVPVPRFIHIVIGGIMLFTAAAVCLVARRASPDERPPCRPMHATLTQVGSHLLGSRVLRGIVLFGGR